MLVMNLEKIDKFYIVLALILVSMAVLLIFAIKGIFSSYLTAYEIDYSTISSELRIDKDKLDEAYTWVYERKLTP